jgi:N-methylhydantoinase A
MRYGEQVFEIAVDLESLDWAAPDLGARIEAAFHRAHEALYTYASPDQDVVLVNARASVIGQLPSVGASAAIASREPASAQDQRRVWLGGWTDVPVFDFAALGGDQVLAGPAIVESDTTTVLLRAGDAARFDARGWLDAAVGR